MHKQLQSQLSHDIWWIALAVLFIAIAESDHYKDNPVAYSTFSAWHPISKLILAAVTLRGRHRGLPVAIDKAVMLPSESLAYAEEEDAALRREQTRTWGLDKMPVGSA